MARTSSRTSRAVLALLVGYPLGSGVIWAGRSEVSTAGQVALIAATTAAAFVALTTVERRLVRRGRDLSTAYAVSSAAGTVTAALAAGFAVSALVAGLLRSESTVSDAQFLPAVGAVGVVLAVAGCVLLRRSAAAAPRRPR